MLVGSNVSLRCAGTELSWEHIHSPTGDTQTFTITFRAVVVKPNKYDLTTEPTGTYDLTIKSIQLKQGGLYRCKALLDEASYTIAQVITFSGEILLLFLP